MSSELSFGSGPRRLAGRLFPAAGDSASGRGILFVHGSGSDQEGYRERAAAASADLSATCLTFDLSGHGKSDGSRKDLSARDHLGDCLDAFDTLAHDPAVDPGRIGVCGASYGAYLTAMLIAHRAVGSLLLRAPALYPDSELDLAGGPRNSSSQTPEAASALRNLAAYDGQVLVLESEHDELIPHAIVEDYLSACRHGRHETIRGAGHRLSEPSWQTEFVAIIAGWFGETLAA